MRSLLACTVVFTMRAAAAPVTPEGIEFFEKRVRPILVKSCYPCHSRAVARPMGDLLLDTRDGLLRASGRLMDVVSYRGTIKMPPTGKLPDEQIADLAAWIKMGAPDPRTDAEAPPATKARIDFARARKFWSFRAVQDPPLPAVRRKAWVQSPVDAFILAKLEAQGLDPAPAIDKRALLRRVTFDLIGLPPTPEEVDAFLRDESPAAFRRVVDRLLASPHYGERWARHWLDLVRYSETNGHEYDNDKLNPWAYRDYVIRAFNQDVPYNQFVREHIAGDLLPDKRITLDGSRVESPIATGFFWFGEVLNSATDSVKSRADEVDNQIDVMGKAFLGLTVACARCHDHKFDPIPTADYYALAGVFHSTAIREDALDSPARAAEVRELSRRIRELSPAPQPETRPTFHYRPDDVIFENFESRTFGKWSTTGVAFGEAPEHDVATSLAGGSERFVGTLTSAQFRTGKQLFLHVRISGTKGDARLKERGALRFTIVADGYKGQHIVPEGGPKSAWKTLRLTFERERTCYFEIVDRSPSGHIAVDEIVFSDSKEPPPTDEPEQAPEAAPVKSAEVQQLESEISTSSYAMLASDYEPHDVRVHLRGNHQNLGEVAPRRFLQVIAGEDQPPIEQGSGRLRIAEWLASERNPLTARVMVNRIWQHHFGHGLVRTPDNFGTTGDAPTHAELLDFLVSRFVESGWSIKAMHRLMLLSSVYQMSSAGGEAALKIEALKVDPENKLLQHMPVRRLEAEAIRDNILAVSGTLNPELFGPSVPPYISPYQDGRGKPASGPLDGNGRRSLYIQVRRNFLMPFLLAFDYPLPTSAIGARGSSTVASQALLLMNNEFVAQQARAWAKRAIEAAPEPQRRIEWMYQTAFSRPPEASELREIAMFIAAQGSRPEEQVWSDVAHVLFNSPEFIYVR